MIILNSYNQEIICSLGLVSRAGRHIAKHMFDGFLDRKNLINLLLLLGKWDNAYIGRGTFQKLCILFSFAWLTSRYFQFPENFFT